MKFIVQFSKLILICLVFIPINSCAISEDPSKDSLAFDKSIRIGHLPNGFTYYLKPTSDTDKINLNFYVKVGALNGSQMKTEQYAHLLEHLGASKGYSENYLKENTEFKKWAKTIYAATSSIHTPYWSSVQANNSIGLNNRLLWFANIAKMKLEDSLVIREARRVRQELFYRAKGFGINLSINKSLRDAAIFFDAEGETPYTNWLTHYNMGGISIASIGEFYRNWYRPDRMGLVITGNIQDIDSLEHQLIDLYSKISKAEGHLNNFDRRLFYHSSPPRFKTVPRIELNRISDWNNMNSKISLFYRVKNFDPILDTKEKWINEKLYMAMYGMIYQRLREEGVTSWNSKKGAVIDIQFPDRDHPYFRLPVIESKPGTERKNLRRVTSILNQLKKHGFTQKEWDDHKQWELKRFSSKDTSSAAYWEDQIENHFVYKEILPVHKNAITKQWIDSLSLEDMNSYLKENFSVMPEDIYITASAGHPALDYTEKQVRGWIKEATKQSVNLKENAHINTLTHVEEKNTALISQKEVDQLKMVGYQKIGIDPDTGLEILQLDNGVKLLLDNKDTNDNTTEMITISGTSPKGASCFPKSQYYAAISAPEIVKLSGVGGLSRQEIRNKLEKEFTLNAEPVHLRIQQNTSMISTRASFKDLEKYLQLVYLYFTSPREDSLAFNKWKNEIKELYFGKVIGGVSPRTDMINAIAAFLKFDAYKAPSNTISTEQFHQIQHLDYLQAMKCYRAIYGNASQFTFTVSGSYSEEQVLPLLQKYLGNLPSISDMNCPTRKSDNTLPKGPVYHTFYADKIKTGYNLYTVPYMLSYVFPIPESNWKERIVMELITAYLRSKVSRELRFIKGASVYYESIEGRYSDTNGLYSIKVYLDTLDDEFEWVRSECKAIIADIRRNGVDMESKNLILDDHLFLDKYESRPKLKEKVIQFARLLTKEDIKKMAAKHFVESHRYEFAFRNKKSNDVMP